MEKPLPFLIESQGELAINEEVLKVIEKSYNPRLLLFYGTTRQGKSTTLNQIIRGNIDTWKYINKTPFLSQTSQKSLTMGCDIYGPIRLSEIMRRHQLNKIIKEDFDIFFCDTEGLFSLNGQSRSLIPGILTLLQICTFSVIMTNTVPDTNTVDQIASEIQFTKILQQMNKELKSPMIAIYISGYQIDIVGKNDYDDCLQEYQYEREQTSVLVFNTMTKNYPQLNISMRDFRIIPGGPYKHNYVDEPDHEDLEARLYWHSINDIVSQFFSYAKDTQSVNANKVISLMKIVFELFKDFKELPKDPNLTNVLLKYLGDIFNKYSNKQFEKISEEIKNDLKNNYEEYYKMLFDDEIAKIKLNSCIEENMIEIYKSLIPDKMKNFFDNAILKLRNSIETQFEKEFELNCKVILSTQFINNYLVDIINEINKANFKEDINMNIISAYKNVWNLVDKEYEKLFLYFKTKKPKNIDILKNNFNNSIEKIINHLISQKKEWKIFFQEIKGTIQKEINAQYLQIFRTIQYQEDFDKLIKNNEQLFNELVQKYEKKYFTNLPVDKKSETINWIKKICQEEYNKIKQDNKLKPIWGNICKNIKRQIKEKIINYIDNIFNGKKFRNEIDPNLGRHDILLNQIPNELIKSPEISSPKQQELIIFLQNEANNGVILFNKKREQLPLLENVLSNLENYCNQIADKKIKELMSKFYYAEDKIGFNADNFYSLFKNDNTISSTIPENKKEFNDLINEISKKKAHEYNNILVPKLPSWNRIKENLRQNIEKVCNNFYRKIMQNVTYKEDIKYDIKELDNAINSLNLFNGIMKNKHNEIRNLIDEMKSNLIKEINNKLSQVNKWSDERSKLIQNGYLIMLKKSNGNINTTDKGQIVNILVNEVINTPRFFDACKKESQKSEIKKKLRDEAEIIANQYLSNQKNWNDIIKKFTDEKNKSQAQTNEIINLKKQIEDLKRERNTPPPQPQVRYFAATPYRGPSIVDGLKAINEPRTYQYREQIAIVNGIGGYVGSPQQNLHMLKLLQEGRLIKP